MSEMLKIHVMAAVLRQGRGMASVAWLLAAAALAVLCLTPAATVASGAALLSLLAGVVQAYHAVRVAFDAALLDGFATTHTDADPEPIDDALQALGLRAASGLRRGWPERWQGMRGLLRGQFLALIAQALLLLAAVWLR